MVCYTTTEGTEITLHRGKKKESKFDFIVKYKEPGKRERTPKHVHMIVEMYVKQAFEPDLTLRLRNHMLRIFDSVQPVRSYPPKLQFFNLSHVVPFRKLDKVGEFTVEFMLVVTELIMIQEKTNYPRGSVTRQLYEHFGVRDRFSVISSAVLKRLRQ